MAVVRSSDFLRAPERVTAPATLIRQRRLTPSCGEHASTAERTVGPARMIVESLTPRPGIREQNRHLASLSSVRYSVANEGTADMKNKYTASSRRRAHRPCADRRRR